MAMGQRATYAPQQNRVVSKLVVRLTEQRLRLLQIERVKAFGEPAVNRNKQFASLLRRQSRARLIAARADLAGNKLARRWQQGCGWRWPTK